MKNLRKRKLLTAKSIIEKKFRPIYQKASWANQSLTEKAQEWKRIEVDMSVMISHVMNFEISNFCDSR